MNIQCIACSHPSAKIKKRTGVALCNACKIKSLKIDTKGNRKIFILDIINIETVITIVRNNTKRKKILKSKSTKKN